MNDLYIEARLQAIKDIASTSCSDIKDADNIAGFCDEIYSAIPKLDKIIEELEINKQNALEAEESIKEYNVWSEAIEIVKADGKDEKEKINIMGHNSIEEHKQVAKNTNELLNYLIEIIEKNNKRFSFEWAVGGEHATMEIFDNEKEIGYVVNIEPIKYDETGKAINV